MSYYPELDSHIRDKVKVILSLSNYAEVDKIDINKLVNVPVTTMVIIF